jgi:hypothetical protein
VNCSIEEAFSLFFSSWQENETDLVLSVDRGARSEHCKVATISPGNRSCIEIAFTRSGHQKTFDLSAATFSYEDSRAGIVPELVAKRWACFLLAEFPDGRGLLFAEPSALEWERI